MKVDFGKIIINPFFSYAIIYIFVLCIYSFSWSNLYPKLDIRLLLFFFFTTAISMFLALKLKIVNPSLKINKSTQKKHLVVLLILFLGWGINFFYMGTIPLFSPEPIGGFRAFSGIPILHVLLVSFNGFYTTILFERYIQKGNKVYLYLWILSLLPHVLYFSRGMIVVSLVTSFIVFSFYRKIEWKTWIRGFFLLILLLYCFGIAGNIRISKEVSIESMQNSNPILSIGAATKEFEETIIPKEFFWSYLYITSPMANLQNIQNVIKEDYNNDFIGLIIEEFTPDFISKRLLRKESNPPPLITQALNVSTLYAGAYMKAGWIGMILIYLYYLMLMWLYCFILMKRNKYKYIGISTFSMLVYLSIFSNVFVFSGWSLQLLYPLIFGFKFKI